MDYIQKRNELRQTMREYRNKLSDNEVKEYSSNISRKLLELEPIRKAKTIMGFASINNEVDLTAFLNYQSKLSKTILLPRVEQDGNMVAVEFRDWEQTKRSKLGIREPQGEPFPVEEIDVVITPGLVFDGKGFRLGYGKGYYDRFLKCLSKTAFICGVCYEFQVVDNLFPHELDIPVHWIVTDKSELVVDWDYF